MPKRWTGAVAAVALAALPATVNVARAWDHPGHMVTAAIAFAEIERARPDLIDKLGLIFLRHPDPAPFWVAVGDARGKERVRRMFIECARWPDDSKFTPNDRLTWHSARWPVLAEDAPPEAVAAAEARRGGPAGQALEALSLTSAMLGNPEADPSERAFALCWVLHIIGDIHQPMHVGDLFSADFPTGNAGATMSYVLDPVTRTPIPLHVLWDSNALRVPSLEAVDRAALTFTNRHPRSAFAELEAHPLGDPDAFRSWAVESHQIAVDWAFDLETASDPDKDQSADKLVQNMVNFILNGVSPVTDAPELPPGYWERLQVTAEQRITLAGYRIADVILSAADRIEAQRRFMGR
ncbi:S1/P1 nuclease [Acuticoccus sediminis]|nr:S1/P1 nuclease [Acuticoccus sediminis]